MLFIDDSRTSDLEWKISYDGRSDDSDVSSSSSTSSSSTSRVPSRHSSICGYKYCERRGGYVSRTLPIRPAYQQYFFDRNAYDPFLHDDDGDGFEYIPRLPHIPEKPGGIFLIT